VIFSGMAFDGSRIAVRPEFRYTRRADDPVRPVNQFEIAVTVSFDVVRFEGGGG
jgi:hypothetical protein